MTTSLTDLITMNHNYGIIGVEQVSGSFPPPPSPIYSSSCFPFSSTEVLNSSNILSSPSPNTTEALAAQNFNQDQQLNKEQEINYSHFSFQTQTKPSSCLLQSSSTILFQTQQEPLKNEATGKFNEPTNQGFSSSEMAETKPKTQANSAYTYTSAHSGKQDGYNWRKYGEKQVKGTENPRSYYKCSNRNCSMKKKVDRSLDGQITEIVFNGSHNHPKPQACRRTSFQSVPSLYSLSCTNSRVSDQSVVTLGNPQMENVVSMHEESSVSVGEKEFDQTTQTSYSGGDEDDFGTNGKRLKGKNNEIDGYSTYGSRSVKGPRVVVQTTSEIDLLDDGYRWRKYGQKVVKENPNPRSYYKCTAQGCMVTKHVERAAHDTKAVITTYVGRHNHDVPASRGKNRTSLNSNNTSNDVSTPIRPFVMTNNFSFTNSLYSARPPPTYQTPQEPFSLEMFQSPTSFGSSGFGRSNGSYTNHIRDSDINEYGY